MNRIEKHYPRFLWYMDDLASFSSKHLAYSLSLGIAPSYLSYSFFVTLIMMFRKKSRLPGHSSNSSSSIIETSQKKSVARLGPPHLSFCSKQIYWESSFLIEVNNRCSSSLGKLLRSYCPYSPILIRIREFRRVNRQDKGGLEEGPKELMRLLSFFLHSSVCSSFSL
jgi:hypothetical protein